MSAFFPPGHPDHSEKGKGEDKHTNCFSTTEYSRGQSSLTRRPIMTIKDTMFVHFCVQIKQRYNEGACTNTQCSMYNIQLNCVSTQFQTRWDRAWLDKGRMGTESTQLHSRDCSTLHYRQGWQLMQNRHTLAGHL